MLYVALAAVAANAFIVFILGAALRAQIRQAARERDLLVNQVCSLAGKPWQTPPSAEPWADETEQLDHDRYVALPNHFPDE